MSLRAFVAKQSSEFDEEIASLGFDTAEERRLLNHRSQ